MSNISFIQPIPCPSGPSGPEIDVEGLILCDFLPDGTVAGTALAVYEYDESTGLPIGSPTFVIPGTNTPYVAQGTLRPCDEPCLKCDTAVLCDNTMTPASEVVLSSMVMMDTVNVAGADGWNVTAWNTGNATNAAATCAGVQNPPVPVPYPVFYDADWCTTFLANCPGSTPAGAGCALNPGPAFGLTSTFQSVNCGTGSGFSDSCGRYLVEKTFNTDAACTKIRVTSQRFRADGSAKVLIDGQDTGIFGAYNQTSPDGTIILTVAPGAHTMTIDLRDSNSPTWIQGGLTIECLGITPAGTTSVQFLRTTCRSCVGDIISVTDTTLDGQTPYVPGATVTICDPGAGNIPEPCASCESTVLVDRQINLDNQVVCIAFLRRICYNCDGTVSSVTDTLLDGTSPYVAIGNVGPNCGAVDVEEEILCDQSGPFLRRYTYVDGGSPTIINLTLAGAAYVPVPPIVVCTGKTQQMVRLCDDDGAQPLQAFYRIYHINEDGTIGSFNDVSLVGNPYVLTGAAVQCEADMEQEILCDVGAANTKFIRVYQYLQNGAFSDFDNYDFNGAPYVPVGPVAICPEAGNDVEQVVLCDSGASGFQFIRVYRYDTEDGALIGFSDFQFDGTPYVLAGTAELCGGQAAVYQHEEILCDDNGPFLRKYIQDAAGVLVAVANKDLAGIDYIPVGTVHVCDCEGTVLGTICYNPPPFGGTPSQSLTDDWVGSVITGPGPIGSGAHVFTNTNFGGSGLTVSLSASNAAANGGGSIPFVAATSTNILDLGAPRNNITLQFTDLDINEFIDAMSPAAVSVVSGPGVLSAGNTQLNATVDNQNVVVRFPNGTQFINFTSHVPVGSAVSLHTVTFDTIAVAALGQTAGVASVVRDCVTGDISYVDLATGLPVDISVVTIVDCPNDDVELEILCDNVGSFIRQYTYDASGTLVTATDFALDGSTPYVTTGPVIVCPVSVTTTSGVDSELQFMCDSNGPTTFIRRYEWNNVTGAFVTVGDFTILGAPYVPVGTVTPGQCTAAAGATVDVEDNVLCDNNGGFIRRELFNGLTGALISSTDLTFANAPYVPVGTVRVCFDPSFEVQEEVLCDDNVSFLRRYVFNGTTGVLVSSSDLTLAGAPYVAVGTVHSCDLSCCPFSAGEGCTNTGSGTYVSIRNTNGTFSVIDPVTGLPVLAANIIPCVETVTVVPTTSAIDSTIQRQTGAGSISIPAGARSITLVVLTGTASVVIAADPAISVPAGVTLTWSIDTANESLLNIHAFTGVAGSDFLVTTTRM